LTKEFFDKFMTKDETGSEVTWGPSSEDEESNPSVGYPATPADSGIVAEYSKYSFPIAILDLWPEYGYDSPSPSTTPQILSPFLQSAIPLIP
jgi:hypothetical protein